MSPKIFCLLAGEPSGDLHGAALMRHLKKTESDAIYVGVGGAAMEKEGLQPLVEFNKFQVMGFIDVFKALPRLFLAFHYLKRWVLHHRPNVIITIDYPGFNLRFAKKIRKLGFSGKLVHYVSPTVWIWGKSRIQTIVENYDLLLPILPFEAALYPQDQLKVHYVGNPLVSSIRFFEPSLTWRKECGISNSSPFIAVFPGSRTGEITRTFPVQLQSILHFLKKQESVFQIVVSVAKESHQTLLKMFVDQFPQIKERIVWVPFKYRYECMKYSQVSIATSGTVVLELGLFGTPTVVVYKNSLFNYVIARALFRINFSFYSLVNILLEKEVFPEYISWKVNSEKIGNSLYNLFHENSAQRKQCIKHCHHLLQLLGQTDASKEAAWQITQVTK